MSEAKQALLLNDTALAGNHGSQLVINQLNRLADSHDIKIVQRHPLDVELKKLATDGLDLVIVNGEGSLHHSKKAARAIAAVPAWAEQRGLRAFLINSIYQENDAAILEGVRKFKQVYVRDDRSFEELQGLGEKPKAAVDLSLTWQPDHLLAEGRSTVIVTDSTLRGTNAELFAFSQGLSDSYFMPFKSRPQAQPGNAWRNYLNRSWFRTRQIVSRMQPKPLNRARYANILPTFEDLTEFMCNRAKLIVAGRYHAVCIALDLQIPFVAVSSNSFKVEALLEEVGMENRLISAPLSHISEQELRLNYGSYTNDELKRITEYKDEQCNRAHLMFDEIGRQC